MNEELEQVARDIRRKERELWAGNPPRMGNGAVALMLDGYASRIEVALGLAPRPRGKAAPVHYTPKAAPAEDSPRTVDRLKAYVRELCDCLEEEDAEAYKLLVEKARRAAQ